MTLPGNPRDVHVNVIMNSTNKGDFRIEPDPVGSPPKGSNGELIFENDGHSGFWIYFHLQDPNGLGYKFPEDKKLINETVWSQLGENACPEEPIADILTPRKVLDDGMTLKVRNVNLKPDLGKFTYTLRVTRDGGESYHDLDPGGDNKNGPISSGTAYWIAPTVAGGLVGFGASILANGSLIAPNALLMAIGGAVVGLVVGLLLGRR